MKKMKRASKSFFEGSFPLVLAVITFLVTAALVITGGLAVQNFEIEMGEVSPARFIAPRNAPNEYATERAREEAYANVVPVFIVNSDTNRSIVNQIDRFFSALNASRRDDFRNIAATPNVNIDGTVISTANQHTILLMSASEYDAFEAAIRAVANMALTAGIESSDSVIEVATGFSAELHDSLGNWDTVALAESVLTAILRPNTRRDISAEEESRYYAVNAVQTVYILQGQVIVDVDELVTEEIYLLIEHFGLVNSPLRTFLTYLGLVSLVFLLIASMAVYIFIYHKELLQGKKKLMLLFTIYTLVLITAWAMSSVVYYSVIPVLLFAVLVAALLETRLAVVLMVVTTLACSLVYGGGYDFVVYFLVTGLTVCLFAKYTADRNQVFRISILFAVVSAVVVMSLNFISGGSIFDLPLEIILAVVMPVVIVIFAVGSLPFWEAAFGIATPNKLLELIGPDKPLIRKMAAEAPGTYHHSLIVANLAETAALDIGANHILARVGGFYHDIGKLSYPKYYSENIVGKNPHDDLGPLESAGIIFEHVENGLKLASRYKVPHVIRDFIQQHHGNTLMAFFYHKAKQLNPNGTIDEADFRYPHPTPNSKEIAIVMLADTCEAAVRSVAPSGKDFAETCEFVRKLIKHKLEEQQLAESSLSIRDLDIIAESFNRVFKGMYHDRVKYEKKDETPKPTDIGSVASDVSSKADEDVKDD